MGSGRKWRGQIIRARTGAILSGLSRFRSLNVQLDRNLRVTRMDETEATRQAAEHGSTVGQAGYLLALAAWGAITHAIQQMRRAKSISIWSLVGETFVCVFAGFLAGLISSGLGASESLTWAAAAAGGHFGPRTLYLLRDRLFERIGGEQ